MLENWYQMFFWRHVKDSGMAVLGMGKLRPYGEVSGLRSADRAQDSRHGHWSQEGNIFDALLADSGLSLVALEYKLEADEHSIAQCLRYLAFLRKWNVRRRVMKEPHVALITIRVTNKFIALLNEIKGMNKSLSIWHAKPTVYGIEMSRL